MAYDDYLADRIRLALMQKKVAFDELKMMGGLCFKVADKMLCGIHIDKKLNHNLLMARVGEGAYEKAMQEEHVLPMDFTGRPMKGYVFVTPHGIDTDDQLAKWLEMCLVFNPLAKSSKRKKKI